MRGVCVQARILRALHAARERVLARTHHQTFFLKLLTQISDCLVVRGSALPNQDMKDAQRVCFAFTIFNLVPVLVVSVLLVAAALAAVAIAVALAQLAISCLLVVFVFSHSR